MKLMNASLRAVAVTVNRLLAPLDLKLTRTHDWGDVANFIPFERTIAAARKAGVSVGDYVDSVMSGTPGATQDTIDKMVSLGVFSEPLRTVVEIGLGAGHHRAHGI